MAQPTLGAALLGVLEDLRYAQSVEDYFAHHSKEMFVSLIARGGAAAAAHLGAAGAGAGGGAGSAHDASDGVQLGVVAEHDRVRAASARDRGPVPAEDAEEFAEFQTKLQAKASRT